MTTLLYLAAGCFLLHVVCVAGTSFSYANVNDWPTEFEESCGGTRQSPIDIDTDYAEYMEFNELVLTGYDATMGVTQTLVNNGNTVELMFEDGDYTISGAGLDSTYIAAQLHFHWGSVSSQGSEHTINEEQFPAEMHIVHVKDGMTAVGALSDSSGYAVLGFHFEVSDEDNEEFEDLIDAVENLNGSTVLNSTIVIRNLLPDDLTKFYRYAGSLTTPDCNEAVVWTMFEDAILLSENQLDAFRMVMDNGTELSDNYRPTQSLNDRTIYTSSNGNMFTVCLMALILAGIVYVSL